MNISKKKIYIVIGLLIAFTIFNSGKKTYKLTGLTKNSVVVAFGDSLTHGTGAARQNSYPALLSKLTNLKVVNSGVPGELSATGLQRLPSVLSKEQPNLVILCHGGNDLLKGLSVDSLKLNLIKMVQLIRDSDCEVIFISVPQKGILLSSLPLYQKLADELKIPCEDEIIASVLSTRSLKSDYIHPNAKGYQLIAEAIKELIDNASN